MYVKVADGKTILLDLRLSAFKRKIRSQRMSSDSDVCLTFKGRVLRGRVLRGDVIATVWRVEARGFAAEKRIKTSSAAEKQKRRGTCIEKDQGSSSSARVERFKLRKRWSVRSTKGRK